MPQLMDLHNENKQTKASCQTNFFNCCHIAVLMLMEMWIAFGSVGIPARSQRPPLGSRSTHAMVLEHTAEFVRKEARVIRLSDSEGVTSHSSRRERRSHPPSRAE